MALRDFFRNRLPEPTEAEIVETAGPEAILTDTKPIPAIPVADSPAENQTEKTTAGPTNVPPTNPASIPTLQWAFDYFRLLVHNRLAHHFLPGKEIPTLPDFSLYETQTPFANFLIEAQLDHEEFVLLMTALAPHLDPGFYTQLISKFLQQGGEFPEFGGVRGIGHRGILPTGETALFILADSLDKRLMHLSVFGTENLLSQQKIVYLEPPSAGEPALSGRLAIDPEFVELFMRGQVSKPQFSMHFPAQYISTRLDWTDLVLPPTTKEQISELEDWINHQKTLMQDWGMSKRLKAGYRALFYGPPGTGKTLTASLLGKRTKRDVYRIDLSTVVSKYIGETEKNLASLFDKAQHKEWILFFDEADSLFGKRTNVRDAHDKYANQEVSYLLQRIEDHAGLVILASNFRNNIDEAFTRRFQSIIYFPVPQAAERLELWRNAFPEQVQLDDTVNLQRLADTYELSGANIMNVVQFCCLQALAQNTQEISFELIKRGIQREFIKEGKMV